MVHKHMDLVEPEKLVNNGLFVAYRNTDVEYASKALQKKQAEAVVMQPNHDNDQYTATEKAMEYYRSVRDGGNIPILFTTESRHSSKKQYFEYASRLISVLYKENKEEVIEPKLESGEWILASEDEGLFADNFLIVKNPIVSVNTLGTPDDKIDITESINILDHRTAEPCHAVSRLAPKLLKGCPGILETIE